MKNELISNYTKSLQAIYAHVGFVEDWVVCPLDDNTDKYWGVQGIEVKFADSKEEFESENGNCYSGELYTNRFYKKHMYEGSEFTMVFFDGHTDGMKWFVLFDNTKKMY